MKFIHNSLFRHHVMIARLWSSDVIATFPIVPCNFELVIEYLQATVVVHERCICSHRVDLILYHCT